MTDWRTDRRMDLHAKKAKIHLRHTDTHTGCGHCHADESLLVAETDGGFRLAIESGIACAPCKEALRISDLKVQRAYAAYVTRLAKGWTSEESIRNTRQEFHLTEREEDKLLRDYKADKFIESLS